MIPRTPKPSDENLIDNIFAASGFEHDEQLEVKWVCAITLIAHVLARTDDVGRERALRGLEAEARKALSEIKTIRRTGHGGLQ
jgi:hypothetical protein